MALSRADAAFVRKQANWRGGPTFDIRCYLRRELDRDRLLDALMADDEVLWQELEGVPWTDSGAGLHYFVWTPRGRHAVGLCIESEPRLSQEVQLWIYPPHVLRATGKPWLGAKDGRDPRVRHFLLACASLVRRIHARCRLRAAVIADETNADEEVADRVLIWPPVKGVVRTDAGWSLLPLDDESHSAAG